MCPVNLLSILVAFLSSVSVSMSVILLRIVLLLALYSVCLFFVLACCAGWDLCILLNRHGKRGNIQCFTIKYNDRFLVHSLYQLKEFCSVLMG